MKNFIKNSILFSLPFLLYASLIVYADPYDHFNIYNGFSEKFKKDRISRSREVTIQSNLLSRLNAFEQQPHPNLIIGASRSDKIDLRQIEGLTGEKYANLSFPGANLAEVAELFWWANQRSDLRKVYLSITFDAINIDPGYSRLDDALERYNKAYSYLTDKFMVNQAFHNLRYVYTMPNYAFLKSPEPKYYLQREHEYTFRGIENKAEKMKSGNALIRTKPWLGGVETFPIEHMDAYKKIAEYCEAKKIELNFIFFPGHIDFITAIEELGIMPIYNEFKNELANLGNLYDFEYPNEITTNTDLYSDLSHTDQYTIERIVHEIWSQQFEICRYTSHYLK